MPVAVCLVTGTKQITQPDQAVKPIMQVRLGIGLHVGRGCLDEVVIHIPLG